MENATFRKWLADQGCHFAKSAKRSASIGPIFPDRRAASKAASIGGLFHFVEPQS
jgi:hypothetical protein